MTTKKKKKQTAKDDLIESLMNDVQELSGHDTMHGNAAADLFSNNDFADQLMNEVGDESDFSDHHLSGDKAATDLWEQLKKPLPAAKSMNPAPPEEESLSAASEPAKKTDSVIEIDVGNDADEAPPTPQPAHAYVASTENDDKTMNLNEVQNQALQKAAAALAAAEPKAAISTADPKANSKTSSPEPSSRPETNLDNEKTVAVAGFANRQPLSKQEIAPKVSLGSVRGPLGGSVYAANDATLAQSESLRLAQSRILELEKEVEKYRYENDELASAGEIIRERAENLNARISAIEGEKQEIIESLQNEIMILKGNAQYKETEFSKARLKIEELEGRLKSDFKKIRVRERELENRLELVKAEKSALLRAKDENILDLKRKIDHLQSELDNYRVKVLELNKTIDINQEQFKRTVRALRLALSNLEVKEESPAPFKKVD